MKLRDSLLISLCAGFLIIGIHQTMVLSFAHGYWALMLSLVFLFLLSYLRRRAPRGKSKGTS
jgi:hypothetical protein